MFDIKIEKLLFDCDRSPVGEIWIETNELAFPCTGWSDFALVVMDWLGLALLKITDGSQLEIFDFMEGPYSIEIQSLSGGMLQISGKSGPDREHEEFRLEASSDSVIRLFTARASHLINLCVEHRWWSSDAGSLKATTHELRRSLTRSVS